MTADSLKNAIVLDQLAAVRKTVAISIPVNMVLGVAVWLVAWHSGKVEAGTLWFGLSIAVNLLRILLCRQPVHELPDTHLAGKIGPAMPFRWHLHLHWFLALVSGICWGAMPLLSDGYTSPETLFYLTVVCGITAGAVTHGFAYAAIPICFITPPLFSMFASLVWAGGFDRYCLAAAVVLYLGALIRGTRVGQELVKNESRLKNEATHLSRSLEVANLKSTQFAMAMKDRAIHDDLTGLLNRRGFSEVLERISPGGDWCLMLLDLDGFKSVNDAFGHKAGDTVLVEVASRLQTIIPKNAHLARLGGDEFAVFFNQELVAERADILATRFIAALADPFSQLGAGRIGLSVGIYRGEKIDNDEMLIYADTALYVAKHTGRNRYRLFDEQLRRDANIKRDIERDLPDALASGHLEVWYQPIMADGGATLNTLEALLRWRHDTHGWIPPQELVGIAAASGLAEQLTCFVLDRALSMAQELQASGLGQTRVAINVSPRELSEIGMDEMILTGLASRGLPTSMLEIEITEEVAINPRLVQGKLSRLANAGVHLAIDDFGTGYSSLGSLQHLHVGRVKIDKSFVTGISGSREGRSLVDAVLRVSGAFGFDVVAEGVETEADRRAIVEMGCPLLQGYLFARPMPQEQTLQWIAALDNRNEDLVVSGVNGAA